MRLRISNSIVPLAVVMATALRLVSAADGAEPVKSTIRIVAAAPAPAEDGSPQRIVLPSQPAAPVDEPRARQPEAAPIRVVPAAPPAQPAEAYPVRQAIHEAPHTPSSEVVATNATEPNAAGPNIGAPNVSAPNVAAPAQPAPTSGRTPLIVNVHASPVAQAGLSRMPRRMTLQPRPKSAAAPPRGKPFQSLPMEPAVSAYLNMYRREADANGVPNYFAFVLPQLEQQQANRQQAAELQKLRGQVQGLSSANGTAATSPNMGVHARYMDTAQYYGGMKR
jgi:hypothetical protein